MHWIHFIGRQYYSEKAFVKEAKKFGISRRVSLKQLTQMEFGDTVWLAINDGSSCVVFGKFVVTTLFGLPVEEVEAFAKESPRLVNNGGIFVSRGCGSYIQGPTYAFSTNTSLRDIANSLADRAKAAEDSDKHFKPMIGGELIEVERVRGKSMRFAQGFRRFHVERFLASIEEAKVRRPDAKVPLVTGHFYQNDPGYHTNVAHLDEHRVTEVQSYRRRD